jgi:hypothetical protein
MMLASIFLKLVFFVTAVVLHRCLRVLARARLTDTPRFATTTRTWTGFAFGELGSGRNTFGAYHTTSLRFMWWTWSGSGACPALVVSLDRPMKFFGCSL